MIEIVEYMLKPKSERQAHLDLALPCIERGGGSPNFKGLLADRLDTTIPSGYKINLSHACHNGICSNWKHLYWGTASENQHDRFSSPKWLALKKPRCATNPPILKTKFEVEAVLAKHDRKKWGWVTAASKELGVSGTTLRRLIKKHKIYGDVALG